MEQDERGKRERQVDGWKSMNLHIVLAYLPIKEEPETRTCKWVVYLEAGVKDWGK